MVNKKPNEIRVVTEIIGFPNYAINGIEIPYPKRDIIITQKSD
jgi:hypothetical protein